MDINERHLNILVIEDNPGDARLIEEYLAPKGRPGPTQPGLSKGATYSLESIDGRLRNVYNGAFTVTIADRLESGKQLLDEESFDAVLLDLTLPDSEGLATFERLNSHAPTVPIIVLTGLDSDYFGIGAVKKGAQDYLIKGDIDRSILIRAIRYAIERAALESQIVQSNESLEERVTLRTKELEAERARASRSEQLAMIGQLSGGIAHDLRNPLGAIKNAAYLVKKKFDDDRTAVNPEDITHWIDLIVDESIRANEVITNLLAVGSHTEPKFSEIQIGDIIQSSLTSFVLNEDIILSIAIDPDLPTIMGDASQLVRAIQNLMANAQEAMEEGGRLEIAAHRANGSVEIVITDTGSGILEENMEKIFEPLYSDKTYGTGLGLAICQEIISNHRGTISVISEVREGTSFTIQIPFAVRDNQDLGDRVPA